MFNNKFGLKADFGYNNFKDGVFKILTQNIIEQTYKLLLLGRIMNFETWTNTVGLLAHTGFGLGFLENNEMAYIHQTVEG
jgi:OOP family OmpA-OmpF porin